MHCSLLAFVFMNFEFRDMLLNSLLSLLREITKCANLRPLPRFLQAPSVMGNN